MQTLTRYLLRAHAGPFLFAFGAITGLLFLTAIAQRFQELSGKGVGLAITLELMVLSLPHVVTLSVPMALFAATLYVIADLAASNELLAIAAGGVHPGRLLAPLVVVGLGLSLLMVVFNDRILAEANARFQDRLQDVSRKRPTAGIREGAMNAFRANDGSQQYILVRSINTISRTLHGVTITDLNRPNEPRYVTAESASVSVLPNRRDLLLELQDGQFASADLDRPGTFHTGRFQTSLVTLRGLAAGVERGERVGERAERELSIGTLRARIRADHRSVAHSTPAVRGVAEAGTRERETRILRSRGELHRRYATAFVCVVFILLAVPLGIRFAHAGLGAVILLSVAVLFFFRVGIIWGDRLADAERIDPILGGWGAVAVLFLIALLLLRDIGGAVSSSRTGVERAPGRGRG